MQSTFAVLSGAVVGPIGAEVGFIYNIVLGGATNALNTAFNSATYSESGSLSYGFSVGALTASMGANVGLVTTKLFNQIVKPYTYPIFDPALPALLQPRIVNQVPGFAGAVTSGITSGTSSFVPGKESQK